MTLSIPPQIFKTLAAAMGRESSGQIDLPRALPVITQFLQGVKPINFEAPQWNWHQYAAWVETPQALADEIRGDHLGPDAAVVAIDISCDAGLFVFNVETQTEGIWSTHVYPHVLVAKTDSWWDGFKRYIGYEDDVKTDNLGFMYIPNGYSVDKVMKLRNLAAAQALYTKICR